MRTCPTCYELLPDEAFYSAARTPHCKPCSRKKNADWRASRPEYFKGRYRAKKEQQRNRYRQNKERILAKLRTTRAEVRAANPRRKNTRSDKLPPDLARANRLASYKRRNDRILATPQGRVRLSITSRIRDALSGKRRAKLATLLGYTADDLVRHLERQFHAKMTWNNYGTAWHIDHIVPVSAFTFKSEADAAIRACWALSNLRPLWRKSNIKKGAKRTHLL